MKTKLLLTGATGWIGQRLVVAASEGLPDYERTLLATEIRALIPAAEKISTQQAGIIEPVFGDIRDVEALRAFLRDAEGSTLIHVAGIIHPPGRTSLFHEINCEATLQLADMACAAGIRRMVVMSSNSPFGANKISTDRFDETSPYNPYMGYGISKRDMELGLRSRMSASEMEITIIRAPWFYGLGQPPRQSLFFKMIREGRFPIVGSGKNRRSMAYTDNLAHGILLAAIHQKAAGEIFWLADERPYEMVEIVETIAAVLEEDFNLPVARKRIQIPGFAADIARVADASLQRLSLYHQKIHVLSEMNLTISCSIEKAKKSLGFVPRIELREGMRRSIHWCLKEGAPI